MSCTNRNVEPKKFGTEKGTERRCTDKHVESRMIRTGTVPRGVEPT